MARPHKRGPKRRLTRVQRKNNAENSHVKWASLHSSSFSLYLSNESDADVIAKLSTVPNKKEYLVGLVRNDIKK
jgi:hypothetical protein